MNYSSAVKWLNNGTYKHIYTGLCNWLLYKNPVYSQTFWSQDPFALTNITEDSKEFLFT